MLRTAADDILSIQLLRGGQQQGRLCDPQSGPHRWRPGHAAASHRTVPGAQAAWQATHHHTTVRHSLHHNVIVTMCSSMLHALTAGGMATLQPHIVQYLANRRSGRQLTITQRSATYTWCITRLFICPFHSIIITNETLDVLTRK